ncbi:MAG: tRNA (adenine-N1)-methyltransferase [Thaumarchaeota archaeon]|nr:tRNA (adenine-N1)-methyltransferase [Nitrososphaerota archaeon]
MEGLTLAVLETNTSEASSGDERITEEGYVLVYRDRRRRWLVRPKDTPKLHTHLGILDVSALVGMEYGITATTTLGDELTILRPTIEDMIMKLSRRTQVIYPKDLGLMVVRLGVHSGSKVVETGTGSGATTALLAYLVRPAGRVYTYEIRPEFQEVARRNIERTGLGEWVSFRSGDSRLGFDVKGMDAGVLDVGDPWEVVASMKASLKPSAPMVAVTPTTNQAEKLVAKMKEQGFVAIESVEVLTRNLEARVGMTRPSNMMVGHTAYLTFGRKSVKREAEGDREPDPDLSTPPPDNSSSIENSFKPTFFADREP